MEAVRRMQEETPGARGNRLVDALLAWLSDDPDHQLEDLNRFQVYVSKALFMTVWRPSTRSAENSCGIRQG